MAKGEFRWAGTATLAGTAVVEALEDGSLWHRSSAFNADGTVKPDIVGRVVRWPERTLCRVNPRASGRP